MSIGHFSRRHMYALLTSIVMLVALASPVHAHHSTANFDFTKTVNITGVVTYISLTNPHSFFDIDVEGPDGVQHYKVFATARVALLRNGWRPDTVRPGDTISIMGNPDKKDPSLLNMREITFADGTQWSTSEVYE